MFAALAPTRAAEPAEPPPAAAPAASGSRPPGGAAGVLIAIGRSLVDRAQAQTRVRATLVDAVLSWTLESESRKTRVGFEAGLRAFRFEENRAIEYESISSGFLQQEFINTTTDASGLGPRG